MKKKFLLAFCCLGFLGGAYALKKLYKPYSQLPRMNVAFYQEKHRKKVPDWIQETIDHELAFFKKEGIEQEAVNKTFEKICSHGYPYSEYVKRYRIIGDRVYVYDGAFKSSGYRFTHDILRTLMQLSRFRGVPKPPQVDVLINHADSMPCRFDLPHFWETEDIKDQAPVFSGGREESASYVAALPHYAPMPGWSRMSRDIQGALTSWKAKKRAACWRGNILINAQILSDPDDILLQAFYQAQRSIACILSKEYPKDVDAGFSYVLDWIPSEELRGVASQYRKKKIPWSEHIGYAYLPLLDGAGMSWAGFEWRLMSGSLVMRADSKYVSWMQRGVKPYEHFVPVHENLDNLIETIRWAREHDQECAQIAKRGFDFAKEHLTLEGLYYYIFKMFEEYEKCQHFQTKDLLEECENNPKWTRIY